MDWIRLIIGTLMSWRNKHELINEYLEYLQKTEGKGDKYVKKTRKIIYPKDSKNISTTDGKSGVQSDAKGLSRSGKRTNKTKTGRKRNAIRRSPTRGNNSKSGLKDKLKQARKRI